MMKPRLNVGRNRWLAVGLVLWGLAPGLSAAELSAGQREGLALAADLCARPPAEDFSWKGVLIVRDRARRESEIPVQLDVRVEAGSWRSVYEAAVTNGGFRERLAVIHDDPRTTRYLLARVKEGQPFGDLTAVPVESIGQSFAQTDFSLLDLGLDFLRWPQQTVLSNAMRKGQACKVLESAPAAPTPAGYSRVLSWVDTGSGGIIYAEAYDYQRRRLKVFNVNGVTKVKSRDRYEVDRMEIRNLLTGSQTTLKFDLKNSGPPMAPEGSPAAPSAR